MSSLAADKSEVDEVRISRRFRPQLAVGIGILAAVWAFALLGPLFLGSSTYQELNHTLEPPSASALFGTDHLGRDQLARIAEGARLSLLAGSVSAVVAALIGIPLGIVAGFKGGGPLDWVISRLGDALLAIPALVLAITLAVALGPNLRNVIVAIAVIYSPQFMRVARGQTLAIRTLQYVDSGRVGGASEVYLMARYILPNIAPALISFFFLTASASLLAEAGLSYLGVSVQPPTPSLGAMVREGAGYMRSAPWMSVFPGVTLLVACIGNNLIGDGLTGTTRMKRRAGASSVSSVPSAMQAQTERQGQGDGEALMSVRGLSVQSRELGVTLVDDVSFDIPAQSVVGIVGESGSGKSLTLKALAGLLPPELERSARRLSYGDRDLRTVRASQARALLGREIGMIFQEPVAHLSPFHTVGAQLAEALRLYGVPRAAVAKESAELLRRAGIDDSEVRLKQYPHQLSGGLAQRVLIALALSGNPKILLADEPTTALDVTVQKQILQTLDRLRTESGISIVLVTHDLAVVRQLCDSAVVMYAGEVVEMASVPEIFEAPRHPYTKALLDAVPGIDDPTLKNGIGGVVPSPGSLDGVCRFGPRCSFHAEPCDAPINLVSDRTGAVRCIRGVEGA